jgi:two-component system sensor histidine kinase/response regulator
MLYGDEPRAFSDPEIRVAQTIADQVAAAVVRKQNKADRERLIEELTRTVKLNELFAGILGHDLRNPLGAILMSAKVLVGKLSDPLLVRTVARIIRSGQRMNRMITQLLDFTRARAGKGLPIERARTDVALVFRQAIDELPDAATIEPPVHFEQDGDTRGWWDADRLSQVASNLIVNAIRHGKTSGPVAARIDGRDPARVTVEVSNAGTIPAEILPGIFEPFHRGDLRDAGSGLGLGLFITREIVTAHQGNLEVTSVDDHTTFKFQLPRGADPAPSARELR